MAFRGFDLSGFNEALRQGYLDRNELIRQQRAADAQDLHNRIIAQDAAKNGFAINDPQMQQALGIQNVPYVDRRDLGYANPGDYAAPQPGTNSDGSLNPNPGPTAPPVISGGYNFPTQAQQETPQMPSPGPYRSGYVQAPPERPATTGMNQPGPWAQTVEQAAPTQQQNAAVEAPKSFTRQTLEMLNKNFPGQVDLEKGTISLYLNNELQKQQAQDAQIQSLMLQNNLRFGASTSNANTKAKTAKEIADEHNATLKALQDQKDANALALERLRLTKAGQPRGATGSLTGGKNPVLDAQYKTQQQMLNNLTKQGGPMLYPEQIKAVQDSMRAMEQHAGGGIPSPPPPGGSPAPGVNNPAPTKTVSKATYFKNTDTTHIIYSDGSTADIKGRPSANGSP